MSFEFKRKDASRRQRACSLPNSRRRDSGPKERSQKKANSLDFPLSARMTSEVELGFPIWSQLGHLRPSPPAFSRRSSIDASLLPFPVRTSTFVSVPVRPRLVVASSSFSSFSSSSSIDSSRVLSSSCFLQRISEVVSSLLSYSGGCVLRDELGELISDGVVEGLLLLLGGIWVSGLDVLATSFSCCCSDPFWGRWSRADGNVGGGAVLVERVALIRLMVRARCLLLRISSVRLDLLLVAVRMILSIRGGLFLGFCSADEACRWVGDGRRKVVGIEAGVGVGDARLDGEGRCAGGLRGGGV